MTKYVLFLFVFIFFCCSKKEELNKEPIDNSPILLEILKPETLGSAGIQLGARVLNLNSEKVIEHGFIIYNNQYQTIDSVVYSVSSNIKTGFNNYLIPSTNTFVEDYSYYVRYYVKTSDKYYYSQTLGFSPSFVKVNPIKDTTTAVGEKITITGDFKAVNNSYYITSNRDYSMDGEIIPFTLNSNKTQLTFEIPNRFKHGDWRNFMLESRITTSTFLARLVILGKIESPIINEYYYNDILRLRAPQVDFRNEIMPFQLIVGKKGFNYNIELSLVDILNEVQGTSFPWGYYNGVDTVYFDKKLIIKSPPANAFVFKQKFAHPNSTIDVDAFELEKHIPVFTGKNTLGDKDVYLKTIWSRNDKLTIGDVSEGEYAVNFSNKLFNYTSNDKIRIEKLKVNSISRTNTLTGEELEIFGNFIDNKMYWVGLGDGHGISFMANKGKINVDISQTVGNGSERIKVGYSNERNETFWVNTDFELSLSPITFTGFSPTSGNRDNGITLYGKGLGVARIYISGHLLFPDERGADFVKIYLPSYILPGKLKIAVFYNNQWLTVDQYYDYKY